MNLFECLKDIITIKTKTLYLEPDFNKIWNSYMICRYLSMDKRFFNISEKFNKIYLNMTPKQAYLYLSLVIPKQRNSFIRYISKAKN